MSDSLNQAQRAYDAQMPEDDTVCPRCECEMYFDLKALAHGAMQDATRDREVADRFVKEWRTEIDELTLGFELALTVLYGDEARPCDEHAPTKDDEE